MPNVQFNSPADNVAQKANAIEKSMSKRAVVLIWASWCHHCISMKPEWERVKSDMAKDDVSFVEIESVNIDRLGNANPKLMKKLSPTSQIYFPMIKTVEKNNVTDYAKDRSYETMKSSFESIGKPKPKPKPTLKATPKKNT